MDQDFSNADEVGSVDLFGNPYPQVRGKGRPAHVPTAETRGFVNMLFVCGHDVMAVARAIGLKKTAFYEHYRPEIAERDHAAIKFKGHQMLRLNRLAAAGNVAAEKALAGMIAGEQVKAIGAKVQSRKPHKVETKGVKAMRDEAAKKVEGRFAPRSTPPSAMVN